ncbi:MAG: hypothetical protein ACYDHH_10095 [Solirubrobacteraceae bacterium]
MGHRSELPPDHLVAELVGLLDDVSEVDDEAENGSVRPLPENGDQVMTVRCSQITAIAILEQLLQQQQQATAEHGQIAHLRPSARTRTDR